MNVAVLSIEDPYEHAHGGTLRTRALIDALLAAGCGVTCLSPAGQGDPEAPADAPTALRRVVVPGPSLGARRWPTWLRRLKRAALPMPTQTGGHSPELHTTLRGLDGIDLLVVSQIAQAGYVGDLPGARLWIDFSDLHSEFLRQEVRARRGPTRWTAMLQRRQLAQLERMRAEQAAIVTTAGWADREVLAARIEAPVTWLPTPVTTAASSRVAPHDPPVAGFLGNFGFWPNRDAYQRLRTKWAPPLRALGWRVVVAGLHSNDLPASSCVELLGPVADVTDFYDRTDVALAPLTLGGGMKVKVVEALLHGCPVIATPFAVEGFPPAIRSLTHLVDAGAPRFDLLAHGPPPRPSTDVDELRRFSREGFRRQTEELVAQL